MQTVNPVKLEYLMECLIFGFAYNEHERRFVIVSYYPERSPGSVSDFVGLVFQDVNRFHREAGDLRKWARFKFRYRKKDEIGDNVYQNIETREGADGWQYVRFHFGPNFGGIAFEYRNLEVHRRGSSVVEIKKNDFIYFDAVSMKEFDVYNPFPDLLNNGAAHEDERPT